MPAPKSPRSSNLECSEGTGCFGSRFFRARTAQQSAFLVLLNSLHVATGCAQEPGKILVRKWKRGVHFDRALELPVGLFIVASKEVRHPHEIIDRQRQRI